MSRNQPQLDRKSANALGLNRVYSPEHCKPVVDIIFIHGLGGRSHYTWSYKKDLERFWPVSVTGATSEQKPASKPMRCDTKLRMRIILSSERERNPIVVTEPVERREGGVLTRSVRSQVGSCWRSTWKAGVAGVLELTD